MPSSYRSKKKSRGGRPSPVLNKEDQQDKAVHYAQPSLRGDNETMGRAVFSFTFVVSLATYIPTTSHGIAGGDSGELVAEGCTLGTAHPPGYPLYTLLVFFVTQLCRMMEEPTFTPAYCANLMSCIFGSLSSGLIASSVFHMSDWCLPYEDVGKARPRGPSSSRHHRNTILAVASVAAGLLHTFSPLAWQYSITAEVFALHSFFVTLLISVAIRFSQRRTRGGVLTGAFLCGLSLSNQHTSVLLDVPLILWVLSSTKMHRDISLLVMSGVCFLLGLTPYVALPVLATIRPHAGSWGYVTSLEGFLNHLRRRDYGSLRLYSGHDSLAEGLFHRCFLWFSDFALVQAGHPSVAVLALLGFLLLVFSHNCGVGEPSKARNNARPSGEWDTRGVGRMLVASLVFYLVVFHSLSNLPLTDRLLYGVHQRFWLHPNIFAFICFGVGAAKLGLGAAQGGYGGAAMTAMVAIPLCSYALQRSLPISDQSTNTYFHNYARGVLETMPNNSLLLINYDLTWSSIRYMQECEGFRRDVTSINLSMMTYPWWKMKRSLYPHVTFPGSHYTRANTTEWQEGGFTFSELLEANYLSFPGKIFVSGKLNFDDSRGYRGEYVEVPYGFLRHFLKRSDYDPDAVDEFRLSSLEPWRTLASYHRALPEESKYPEETWEWTIRRKFFTHLLRRSTFLLEMALLAEGKDVPVLKSLVDAASWLETAQKEDPASVSASLKKNLGIAYMHMVKNKEVFPLLPDVVDVFNSSGSGSFALHSVESEWRQDVKSDGTDDWKSWARGRWRHNWEEFVGMADASKDPSFDQIKKYVSRTAV